MSEQKRQFRPRADEDGGYLWRFKDIPKTIERDGQREANPLRQSAVFVVHGFGEQDDLDTAILLRDGFEDAIDQLRALHGLEKVPVPFTSEGYWGNYDNLEQTFPDEWAQFNTREQAFFSGLWKRRTSSALRTFFWFMGQMLRLVFDPSVVKKAGPLRGLTYWGMAGLGCASLVYMLVRHPKMVATVLGDVRLYLAPRGDIEKAIVQRIDFRIGEKFLSLLGLGWDFRALPDHKGIMVDGSVQVFSHVTWIAHSLGSVISYNVISDLLARCQELRAKMDKPMEAFTFHEQALQKNIEKVEQGLHRFVTIGSPLEKIAFLFPGVLRPWPESHLQKFAQDNNRSWWINFFHIWDPVSGRLGNPAYFGAARNAHGRLWRAPLWAHVSYWQDKKILTYMITRAYGAKTLKVPPISFITERRAEVYRWLSLTFCFIVLCFAVKYWDRLWPVVWRWATFLAKVIPGF